MCETLGKKYGATIQIAEAAKVMKGKKPEENGGNAHLVKLAQRLSACSGCGKGGCKDRLDLLRISPFFCYS